MTFTSQAARLALGAALASIGASAPASPYSDINAAAAANPIKVDVLRRSIRMFSGSGGNVGVLSGPNGLLMVDTGIAVSQHKIRKALGALNSGRLRYVINTHWHWDHSDGNAWVRRTGATIMADPLAIRRLRQTNRIVEWEHTFTPVGKDALPGVAIPGDKTLSFNGETLRIRHYRPGHTDGDLSVFFVKADVLQTGDTFWNGMYPFIDYVTGGSINGAIAAANANIAMTGPRTLIIPGHGPVGDKAQLVAFRDMLVGVRRNVAALKARGMTPDKAVAARPTAAWDRRWGRSVISGALFTRLVYRGV